MNNRMKLSYPICARGKALLGAIIAAAMLIGGGAAYHIYAQQKATSESKEALTTAPSPGDAGSTGSGNGKADLGFATTPRPGAETKRALKKADIPTTNVETIIRPETLRLTGALTADEKSEVASNVSGIVSEVRVDRGSLVEKGDVLVQLDPTDAQNSLNESIARAEELIVRLGWDKGSLDWKSADQLEARAMKIFAEYAAGRITWKPEDLPEAQLAKAALELAEANYKRYEELKTQGVIPQAQFDQSFTERQSARQRYQQALYQAGELFQSFNSARARLVTLKKAITDTTIRAPFSGWVVEKRVAPGERVNAGPGGGGTVATVMRVDPLRLCLTVPQQSTGLVRSGQTVTFQVDALPGKVFQGAVRYIAPSVTDASRSLTVEAVVPNPQRVLQPGLFATAELQLERKTKEFFVPSACVIKEGDVGRLFLVKDGAVREVVVSVGETRNNRILIAAGLEQNDVVVLTPEKVRDGDTLR